MSRPQRKSSPREKQSCSGRSPCKNWSRHDEERCDACWKKYWEARQSEKRKEADRSPSQRDYARVVHSSAFRRLQAKTQVLGLGDSDFYRTRLTHSMEVSQIGEGIVRKLRDNKGLEDHVRKTLPDSSQIRAICLAHDLGHPPFGHGGERALNKMMVNHGGFEGNGQSLRIMSHLESYHEKYGMDLTRRTLLGVLKYPAPYSKVENKDSYPSDDVTEPTEKTFSPPKCYLDCENDVINWISENLKDDWKVVSAAREIGREKHNKTEHMSLDASILEAADDVAYGTHDLEDAIAMNLIDQKDFRELIPSKILEPFLESEDALKSSYEEFMEKLFHKSSSKRKQAIGNLVGFFIRNIELDQKNYKYFSNPIFSTRVNFKRDNKKILEALKNIVLEKVIFSPQVQRLEFKGQKVIEELFMAFRSNPVRLLPPGKAELYKEAKANGSDIMCMRIICDYVSGMSDHYAIHRYRQMFEPSVGSLFDYLGR